MKSLAFSISFEVEKATGELLAVYFQIRKGKSAKTREFADGNAFANYTVNGQLLGIELLGPCSITVVDQIAPKEPQVKRFVRDNIPRAMAIA